MDDSEIDSIAREIYEDVNSQIDCTQCGNCCKEVLPTLDDEDIRCLAKGLKIKTNELRKKYLVKKQEDWTFNAKPCSFLKDNKCSCYEYRPKDCRSFPHLYKSSFRRRLMGVISNCEICPIVFNTFERLKKEFPV